MNDTNEANDKAFRDAALASIDACLKDPDIMRAVEVPLLREQYLELAYSAAPTNQISNVARQMGLKAIQKEIGPDGIPSPFVKPPSFDYNRYQDETTIVAIDRIWKLFGENSDLLTYKSDKDKDQIGNDQATVAQKVLEILVDCQVPNGDIQMVIDTFQVAIRMIFELITRQKVELEKEFLARCMNARNPGDHHYSREYGTIKDLFVALQAKRIEQKDDPYGYFYVQKKE